MSPTSTSPDFEQLALRASQVFVPASPITTRDLFSGRVAQLHQVIDAIHQPGQHAVLYGDRGVGKTSLANVISMFSTSTSEDPLLTTKVNCDLTDSFSSLWRKAFESMVTRYTKPGIGIVSEPASAIQELAKGLPQEITPNDIRLLLSTVRAPGALVIFDEFDRLPAKHARVFTDCIKALSDYSIEATVLVVGVASTIDQLVRDHISVERALLQIHMPRMVIGELDQILTKGADKLGIAFSSEARSQIVHISHGLPHYTHLVALHSVRAALARKSILVEDLDVEMGVKRATDVAQHTIKEQYHKATASARGDAIFKQVLLACALAHKDEKRCFKASQVVISLQKIAKRKYAIPAFARHLSEFCQSDRGPVLEKTGQSRRWRYHFINPLLEPYIVMRAVSENLITQETLAGLSVVL